MDFLQSGIFSFTHGMSAPGRAGLSQGRVYLHGCEIEGRGGLGERHIWKDLDMVQVWN